MAMDPAAISANPATTMMRVVVSAPDNPAASAKGTVRPSAIPMTMSRTNSEAVKCDSTCGVCGIFFLRILARTTDSPCGGELPEFIFHWRRTRRSLGAALGGLCAQVSPSVGIPSSSNLLGRSLGHDLSAAIAAFGSEVNHPVGTANHVQVVFDDQDTPAVLDQSLECRKQFGDVVEVQASGGLIEDEQRTTAGGLRQVRRQFHALGFAAAQRGGRLAQSQVAQANVGQDLQTGDQSLRFREE